MNKTGISVNGYLELKVVQIVDPFNFVEERHLKLILKQHLVSFHSVHVLAVLKMLSGQLVSSITVGHCTKTCPSSGGYYSNSLVSAGETRFFVPAQWTSEFTSPSPSSYKPSFLVRADHGTKKLDSGS